MENEAEKLSEVYEKLTRLPKETFEAGAIVEWIPGLKNKKMKADMMIVTEVLKDPIIDDSWTSSSAYYKEQLDLRIGALDSDGDLLEYFIDSRRVTAFYY